MPSSKKRRSSAKTKNDKSNTSTPDQAEQSNPTTNQEADRINHDLDNVAGLLSEIDQDGEGKSVGNSEPDQDIVDRLSTVIEQAIQRSNEQFLSQTAKMQADFESKVDALFEKFESRTGEPNSTETTESTEPSSSTAFVMVEDPEPNAQESQTSDDSKSSWEKQKREMYAQLGEACDDELEDHGASIGKAKSGRKGCDERETLQDSIDSIEAVEAEDIEELRTRLTEKLREAEVELSINRAQLDQRTANLERRQNEIDRREKALAKKYVSVDGSVQKSGLLDRLSQHLMLRKRGEL